MNRQFSSTILVTCFLITGLGKSAAFASAAHGTSTNNHVARWSIYSRAQEEKAGEKIARRVEQPDHILQDPAVSAYVNRVTKRLLAASNLDSSQPITVKILLHPAFNACTLPGGRIYLTVGLLRGVQTEDEMAAVLAHELAHILARDWAHQKSKRVLLDAGEWALPWIVPFGGLVDLGMTETSPGVLAEFSRRAESDADARSLEYLYKAGYDPKAIVAFLKKAENIEQQDYQRARKGPKDHPDTALRIATIERQIRLLPAGQQPRSLSLKELASVQQRLPLIGDGRPTTRIALNTGRTSRQQKMQVAPNIIQPGKITDFMKDATPPTLQWKDPADADGEDDH